MNLLEWGQNLELSMLRFFIVVFMCFIISGCASTSAENVGRGMQYGTAGAGIVGLPIFLAGIAVEKTGRALSESPDHTEDLNGEKKRRPQFGEYSAGIQGVINQTPTPVQIAKGAQPTWNPRLSQPGKPDIKFVVGARPPQFSEATKKKLARQKPSKKSALLVKNVAKAKVTII